MIVLQMVSILFSAIIAAVYFKFLKKIKFKWSEFLKNAALYFFLIQSTNVFLVQLLGWNVTQISENGPFWMKYMLCSLIFSVLYPSVYCCTKYWLQKKKIKINIYFSKISFILLFAWMISSILSITLLKSYFLKDTISAIFLVKFAIVYGYISMFVFSAWYFYKNMYLNISKRKSSLVINLCVTLSFILSLGGFIFYAILKDMVDMPGIISTNQVAEFTCILFMNLTLGLFVISVIDILKKKNQKAYRWSQTIYFILFPILSFVMIEIMIKTEVYTQFIYFLGNLLIYYSLFFILHSIIRSKKLVLIVFGTFCFGFGVADYFVYKFRGTPILPADVWSLKTAASVASGYKYNLSVDFFVAFSLFLVQIIIIGLLFEKRKDLFNFKQYMKNFATCIAIAVGCILLLEINVFTFEVNKWDKIGSYQSNGTALCIYNDVIASWVQEPEGYSVDKLKEVYNNTDLAQNQNTTETVPPNIIVIMNESFSDLSAVKEIKTTEDTMPFIHSLTENTIKGNLFVSIYGGNTCNTEYEFLTGNSLAFLPQGSIPYQQFVIKKQDTISTILEGQNYIPTAIHPYSRYGWRRSEVYPMLGLDTFYSKKDFVNPRLLRGYISDEDSFNMINEKINENKNQSNFIFNVTMQNHGGYTMDAKLDNWISLADPNLSYPNLEQYLTLIHTTDAAFEDLITYYKSCETPTIILMFGDHQPSMVGETYDYLYSDIEDAPLKEQQKKYITPFLIWANYDIEEKQGEVLSPNYLSSYLLDIANVKMTKYNQYLLDLQKKVPAINAFGYLGDDGNWYDLDEETKYSKDLLEYQSIQYNNIFDNESRMDEFFQVEQ